MQYNNSKDDSETNTSANSTMADANSNSTDSEHPLSSAFRAPAPTSAYVMTSSAQLSAHSFNNGGWEPVSESVNDDDFALTSHPSPSGTAASSQASSSMISTSKLARISAPSAHASSVNDHAASAQASSTNASSSRPAMSSKTDDAEDYESHSVCLCISSI